MQKVLAPGTRVNADDNFSIEEGMITDINYVPDIGYTGYNVLLNNDNSIQEYNLISVKKCANIILWPVGTKVNFRGVTGIIEQYLVVDNFVNQYVIIADYDDDPDKLFLVYRNDHRVKVLAIDKDDPRFLGKDNQL